MSPTVQDLTAELAPSWLDGADAYRLTRDKRGTRYSPPELDPQQLARFLGGILTRTRLRAVEDLDGRRCFLELDRSGGILKAWTRRELAERVVGPMLDRLPVDEQRRQLAAAVSSAPTYVRSSRRYRDELLDELWDALRREQIRRREELPRVDALRHTLDGSRAVRADERHRAEERRDDHAELFLRTVPHGVQRASVWREYLTRARQSGVARAMTKGRLFGLIRTTELVERRRNDGVRVFRPGGAPGGRARKLSAETRATLQRAIAAKRRGGAS